MSCLFTLEGATSLMRRFQIPSKTCTGPHPTTKQLKDGTWGKIHGVWYPINDDTKLISPYYGNIRIPSTEQLQRTFRGRSLVVVTEIVAYFMEEHFDTQRGWMTFQAIDIGSVTQSELEFLKLCGWLNEIGNTGRFSCTRGFVRLVLNRK